MASMTKDRREKFPMVFLSFAKENYYLKHRISTFALRKKVVPISLFMNIGYNLFGLVDHKLIRVLQNTLIKRCSELWVFGSLSDGVLIEIYLAKKLGIKVKYFSLPNEGFEAKEIFEDDVVLADVSSWVWAWVKQGKNLERWHPRLRIKKVHPVIYPAYSKKNYYLQAYISKYCIERKCVPLNPFMLFKYFLYDTVARQDVYEANNTIICHVDELWVFGPISDGVLAEIDLANQRGQKVKYFKIYQESPTVEFRNISREQVEFEDQALKKDFLTK